MDCNKKKSYKRDLQLADASNVFRKYVRFLHQYDAEEVLGDGCRSGQATLQILGVFYDRNLMKGLEADNELIQYAKNRPKAFRYCDVDITQRDQVMDFQRQNTTFNQIFSFSALYWIKDPAAAIGNMKILLKDTGELVLGFVASSPVYNTYEKLAENPRWGEYMQDYRSWLPFTCTSDQTDVPLINLLVQSGLDVQRTMTFQRYFSSLEDLEQHVWNVNPFIRRIPEAERADFVQDCICIAKSLNKTPVFLYTVASAQAKKPFSCPSEELSSWGSFLQLKVPNMWTGQQSHPTSIQMKIWNDETSISPALPESSMVFGVHVLWLSPGTEY